MAMNESPGPRHDPADDEGFLPCGRDLADLWERQDPDPRTVDDHPAPDPDPDPEADPDPDAHPEGCPDCAGALAELARLRAAVRHGTAVAAAGREADASRLAANVMDVVRLELRPGRTLALGDEDEDAWIQEAVAARAFRSAAEQVPEVRAGSCRVGPDEGTGARTPARVRIEVSIAVDHDLRAAADRIRRGIADAARHDLGMPLTSIDVVVTDLHHALREEAP
ncbi:Asp23/Gls24 family envelope stress response protein [Streptomyces sp. DK15]|uniref:Asp23/Gls24 family envelope stress response protein n=1 Tax=Streptomyces sp. DK15 TaxID=2957499 RepID=UPI0029B225E4|nr:Asp23/Gls24 family envelope stress response protein [Streptomyces sp. DK15]MDX2388996.1 Asp23/Gls24 family envelope stress response protein [Streptomyces sp. DK15]